MITVLAHGALGYWDEAIMFAIVAIFLGFTVISWLKGRQEPTEITPPSTPESDHSSSQSNQTPTDKSHFELD
jgi:hypothetical protein